MFTGINRALSGKMENMFTSCIVMMTKAALPSCTCRPAR